MKKSHLLTIGLLAVVLLFSACLKDKIDYRRSVDFYRHLLPGTAWQLQSKYKIYRTAVENPIDEEFFYDCSMFDVLAFENDTLLTVSNHLCNDTWGNSGHETWDGFGLGGFGQHHYFYQNDLVVNDVTNTAAILWFSPKANKIRAHYLYCPNDTMLILWTSGYAETVAAAERSGQASKFRLIR